MEANEDTEKVVNFKGIFLLVFLIFGFSFFGVDFGAKIIFLGEGEGISV